MRKLYSSLMVIILTAFLSSALIANEAVLIDFDLLKANGDGLNPGDQNAWTKEVLKTKPAKEMYTQVIKEKGTKLNPQHWPTVINYGKVAGSNFVEAETKTMVTSLAADNWTVVLNSSARTVANRQFSYTREWYTGYHDSLFDNFNPALGNSQEAAAQYAQEKEVRKGKVEKDANGVEKITSPGKGYSIMGVRIKFTDSPFNNWALVMPPFEIPAYEDIVTDYIGNPLPDEEMQKEKGRGRKFLNGYGVVRNVAELKSMNIRVYGCQFKNSISILLKDDNGVITEYNMPRYLDFDGWANIEWVNPNYIQKAENREIYVVPLYPRNEPYVKLYGFRIYRQGDQVGGDFVTYIRDVTIKYDKAFLERETPIIDHEQAWGILQDRNEAARVREESKLGNSEILRYLEKQKMHPGSN